MNENNLWLERWKNRELGFNQIQVNTFMVEHFSSLNLDKGTNILVPLCGKSIDISWLLAQDYNVIGVELSQQAIIELFDALALIPLVTNVGEFTLYSAENIKVFVGDFFKLTQTMLGKIDAIYDRAALVALTKPVRHQYATHLSHISNNAPQLLLSFEYDQSLMDRSPYSVDENEVNAHYAEDYSLSLLARENIEGGFKGKITASDVVWLLRYKGEICQTLKK